MTIVLITGGARSGKSLRAETLVREHPGRPVYIATAEIRDSEMAARVAAHRARRAADDATRAARTGTEEAGWLDHPAPFDLVAALDQTDAEGGGPRLVDCLTLWLTNLMLAGRDLAAETEALLAALARQRAPVVLVTNEVGLGIVPENALARAFRDAQGLLNQKVAAVAGTVELVVAGCPLKVKG